MSEKETRQEAIRAVLKQMVDEALAITDRAASAYGYINQSRNQAIGTIIGLDQNIQRLKGLYIAALALHRGVK